MRLLFKQRLFSWFDSYDIYDEDGNVVYEVKGQLDWGHCLKVYQSNVHLATIKQVLLTFIPRFEIYKDDQYVGSISKEFSFFVPRYNIDFNGWHIEGDIFEWDYQIYDGSKVIASISKELFNLTDTYVLNIIDPKDALDVLAFVLAIDAEKCSRN
ncbi:MAG: LURP-one-related family protein [Firmicutes bacterium]|nr:LURP-one-related family protein [Erysipelotrichaceae bacterium]MDD6524702.1 LURP-one-related family protein [Bacillota bacterium]MDY5997457.1 LURP-one-related family protein [Erysipelotrichaceae bacterium]